jgi:hypothetical protein
MSYFKKNLLTLDYNFIKNIKIKNFKTKNFKISIFGNIYSDYNQIKKTFFNPLKLAALNGEFFFIIKCSQSKKIIIGNSNTSSYQLFFKQNNKKEICLSNDIFKLIDKKTFILKNKICEWLYTNGRNLDEETFFSNIKSIHPGSIVKFNTKSFRILENSPFYYKEPFKKKRIVFYIDDVVKALIEALKIRIKSAKYKISMGLSGGMDSRIILHLLKNNFKNDIFTHTHGDEFSLEKKVSKAVSKLLKTKHTNILIKPNTYYLNAENILNYGNYNSIFKSGVKMKIYKKMFLKNNSDLFIQGNALDVLIGASFSTSILNSFRNKMDYIYWFIKSIKLFNINEIKKILNYSIEKKNLAKTIKKKILLRVNKIKYSGNFVNLNDALTFDLRIKRWHIPQLSVFNYLTGQIIPTFDKFFLKACSKIPSSYRLNDKFRKSLLMRLNPSLHSIKVPELLLNKNLINKGYHIYDSDLGKDMKKSAYFKKFIKKIIYKNNLSHFINDKIVNDYFNFNKTNQRKKFMLITLIMTINKFIDIKKNV